MVIFWWGMFNDRVRFVCGLRFINNIFFFSLIMLVLILIVLVVLFILFLWFNSEMIFFMF